MTAYQVVMVIIFFVMASAGVYCVFRTEHERQCEKKLLKEANSIRIQAKKEATEKAVSTWKNLYVDTCKEYERKLACKDETIASKDEVIEKLQKENARMKYICANAKLVRLENGNRA